MKKEANNFEIYQGKTERFKIKGIFTTAGGKIKKPHKSNYSIVIDTKVNDKHKEKSFCLNLNEKQFFHFLADLIDLYECIHDNKLKLKAIYKHLNKRSKKQNKKLKKY